MICYEKQNFLNELKTGKESRGGYYLPEIVLPLGIIGIGFVVDYAGMRVRASFVGWLGLIRCGMLVLKVVGSW